MRKWVKQLKSGRAEFCLTPKPVLFSGHPSFLRGTTMTGFYHFRTHPGVLMAPTFDLAPSNEACKPGGNHEAGPILLTEKGTGPLTTYHIHLPLRTQPRAKPLQETSADHLHPQPFLPGTCTTHLASVMPWWSDQAVKKVRVSHFLFVLLLSPTSSTLDLARVRDSLTE